MTYPIRGKPTFGIFHQYSAVAVQHRFEPFYNRLTQEIHKDVGATRTDILYRCECGKVNTKTVAGKWTLGEVTGKGV